MTITLKRGPEVAGGVIKLKVWINDDHMTKIALGEEKELTLPKENSVIQIKQFSGRSNSLIVKDGDQVTISNGPVFRWMIVVLSIYITLIIIFDGPYKLLTLFIAAVLMLILYIKAETFKLTKINEKSTL